MTGMILCAPKEADPTESLLQLKVAPAHAALLGTTSNGFVVWDVSRDMAAQLDPMDLLDPLAGQEEGEERRAGLARDSATTLWLPHGTRNISTR